MWTHHEDTKGSDIYTLKLRELPASFENTGVRMGFRIVAWMERSGIQEGGVGRGRANGVRE
jgi:hypothetical protein